MTTKQEQIAAHNRATSEFISLANRLAGEEDQDRNIVSAALMAASGIYATYNTAGNEGFLGPGGIDKVAELYKKNLAYIQDRKREELKAKGKKVVTRGDIEGPAQDPTAADRED